jgi:hypothetical protein
MIGGIANIDFPNYLYCDYGKSARIVCPHPQNRLGYLIKQAINAESSHIIICCSDDLSLQEKIEEEYLSYLENWISTFKVEPLLIYSDYMVGSVRAYNQSLCQSSLMECSLNSDVVFLNLNAIKKVGLTQSILNCESSKDLIFLCFKGGIVLHNPQALYTITYRDEGLLREEIGNSKYAQLYLQK